MGKARWLVLLIAAGTLLLGEAHGADASAKSRQLQSKPLIAQQVFVTVGKCAFRYTDHMQGFRATAPADYHGKNPYYSSGYVVFNFDCYEVPDWLEFAGKAAGKFNSKTSQWTLDESTIRSWMMDDVTADEVKRYTESFRIGDLKTVNADGFYVVSDDITGDEERRERTFRAYVHHMGLVLSIDCRAGSLREPNKSLVPHLLRLLNTVEFVNEPSARAASSVLR